MRSMRSGCVAAAGLALLCTQSTTLGSPPVRFSTIALTGQPAPGLPGVTFSQVSDPRLDWSAGPSSGTIGFWTRLAGTGITTDNDTAFWLRTASGTVLLAREGSAAPGTVGTYAGLTALVVRSDGRAMFTAPINENLGNRPVNVGLFAQDAGGAVALLDREALDVVEIYARPQWSPPGTIAYGLPLVLTRGATVDVAGEPAPGMPGGFVFKSFAQQPWIERLGRVVFHASAGASDDASLWRTGIYSDRDGALGAVVIDQTEAPGVPGGIFASFGREPAIDGQATVVFWASVAGIPGRQQGLWRATGVGIEPVAIQGDGAPGTGNAFDRFGTGVGVSEGGEVVFTSRLAAPVGSNDSIWRYQPGGTLTLLARDGDQAADLPAGVSYRSVGPASMSESGQAAFIGTLQGDGVTPANCMGLWACDPSGRPRLVARTGVVFDIPGVGGRLVRSISFGSDGGACGSDQFSGPSTLAFKLTFEDFSEGLFLAEVNCTADFDASGFVDTDDYSAFVLAFEAGDISADVDGSGFVDTDDFDFFVRAFESGC